MFKPSLGPASSHLAPDGKGFAASVLSPVAEEASLTSGKHSSEYGTTFATGEPPRFLKTPSSTMKLDEGSPIRLDCVISGTPRPKVTWAKNGRLLQSGARCQVIEDAQNSMYCCA